MWNGPRENVAIEAVSIFTIARAEGELVNE
jgi:hypothetical protein